MIRLGVNIDHVATLRNARGEAYPEPIFAAHAAELGGADNITFHLREDRRHIRDADVTALHESVSLPLNFEMALTDEMVGLALEIKPHSVTLVPERRQELTTEGGLNIAEQKKALQNATKKLSDKGILVSLFVEPSTDAVSLAKAVGADAVEFHTGTFCHAMDRAITTKEKVPLLRGLAKASTAAKRAGLQVHFGHGLNYKNAFWLQHIPEAEEANIGHAIIARSVFVGLTNAVREMKALLNDPQFKPFI